MTKTYRSKIAQAMHETAIGMACSGLIDKTTMRRFDLSCLTTIEPLSAEDIQALREREQVSQAVFARFLNVRASLVSQRERGEKKTRRSVLEAVIHRQEQGSRRDRVEIFRSELKLLLTPCLAEDWIASNFAYVSSAKGYAPRLHSGMPS